MDQAQNMAKSSVESSLRFNDKLRLLEVPVGSNLFFQKVLYYHYYYDMLYVWMLVPTGVYKMMIGSKDALIIVSVALTLLYGLTEMPRLNFGFRGNINESFPELIAFTIQTFLFSLAFSIVPLIAKFKFPHEDALYLINIAFLGCELLVGFATMIRFTNT
mmetsp:Transcript_17525/g.29552  ORF Transcript_17525/g.29552 Transcript_17525/m.29552 type:complete len:160 (-) Transcript_17525:202-681(-)